MHIKYIRIKNFQSWKEAQFDLHQGVNVFVGMSDRGKSAVARAIEWVLTNKPSGDEFCSDWGGDTEVSIMLADGIEVSRLKGKAVNEYRLSTLDEPLIGFGKGPPPQVVLDVFNMSEINIQTQDDPYFLFDESPPEIGRRLNAVASLSDIDVAFSNVSQRLRSTKADLTSCSSSLSRERELLAGFDWIDDAERGLKKLESKSATLSQTRTTEMELRNVSDSLKNLRTRIAKYNQILDADELISELEKKAIKIGDINTLLDKLEPIETRLQAAEETIEKTTAVIKFKDEINRLLDIVDDVQQRDKYICNLIDKKKQLTTAAHVLKTAVRNEQQAITEWESAQPDECPLCERPGWKGK